MWLPQAMTLSDFNSFTTVFTPDEKVRDGRIFVWGPVRARLSRGPRGDSI